MSNEYKDWLKDLEEEENYWNSRYPFLKISDEGGCWLHHLPTGWMTSFGEQMCDELTEALGDYVNEWYIIEMKEKFGAMRLYHSGVHHEIYNKVELIIDKYEEISYNTCSKCGAKATKYSKSWILPFCDECFEKTGYRE